MHALGNGLLMGLRGALDINAMFADKNIKAIISSHGGTTVNSCLEFLDWQVIEQNPKILMGFSDLTVLLLALYSKVGLVTFHGNMVMWHFGMNPSDYDRQSSDHWFTVE
jgi:muramoyltetrapeptide carboxypeptidase